MNDDVIEPHVPDDDLVELALGLLPGKERAHALRHIDACAQCGVTLEQFSVATDGILQVVPEMDPPVGFEVRVLERMAQERPPVRIKHQYRRVMASIAAVGAIVVGIGIGHFAVPGNSTTPSALNGTTRAYSAILQGSDTVRGRVVLFGGKHPWMLLSVSSASKWLQVTCEIETTTGKLVAVGTYGLGQGSEAWNADLPVSLDRVRAVAITGSNGQVLAQTRVLT